MRTPNNRAMTDATALILDYLAATEPARKPRSRAAKTRDRLLNPNRKRPS